MNPPANWRELELQSGRSPATGKPWRGLTVKVTQTEPENGCRARQTRECQESRDALDEQIRQFEREGVLVLTEPAGRRYGY